MAKFTNMRFEPASLTDDPDIRIASSVMDYIFRRLALDHLSYEDRAALGILSAAERAAEVAGHDPAQLHRTDRSPAGPHRRRPALPDLRHQDAPGRQLLRLRRLRLHQRLQLILSSLVTKTFQVRMVLLDGRIAS